MAKYKVKNTEEIENEIDRKLEKLPEYIDSKIDEEIEKEIEKEVVSDIKLRVRQKVDETMGVVKTKGEEDGRIFSKIIYPIRFLGGILSSCWHGECRPIIIVVLATYFVLGILIALCSLAQSGICLQRDIFGASQYIILVSTISLLISSILAIFSVNQRKSFIFSFLLYLPIVILILILSVQYLGLIVLGIGIILFFIQAIRLKR